MKINIIVKSNQLRLIMNIILYLDIIMIKDVKHKEI